MSEADENECVRWGGCGLGAREGLCGLETRVYRKVEESISYFRVPEAVTGEELAGCGSGQGITAGTDSHRGSVRTARPEPARWLGGTVYVNQGCYRETAGFTLFENKRTSGVGGQEGRWRKRDDDDVVQTTCQGE